MDTKQTRRRNAPSGKRPAAKKAAPVRERRRKTAPAGTTDRETRRRKVDRRRQTKAQNPPVTRRTVRPPREEIPDVVYTPPKPLRRGRFALRLLSMAAAVAAVFLGLSVFFRVETVTVAGADKYTPWMVREASGIEEGDPLLTIGEARVASRIISNLPYVDEVKVGISLPGTVTIELTELQVTYAIEDANGAWWLISAQGRAVEQVTFDQASGYTRVDGLQIQVPEAGQQIQAMPGLLIDPDEGTAVTRDQQEANEQLEALISVMTGLENNRVIGEVAVIDVTDLLNIHLEYPHLLTVKLGDAQRMDYKLRYMAAAVEKLEDNQSGELDMSLEYTEDAIFTPAS